jgi:hypothetical protein
VHKIRQAPETYDCSRAFPFQPLHVPKLEEQASRTKPIFDAYSGVQMIMFLESVLCLVACVLSDGNICFLVVVNVSATFR